MGPMFLSPLSEVPQLGRRGIYFWTLLAFVLFQLPVGFAVDLPMFLIFRFVTGFCGSPCLSTGGATISDMYDAAHVAYGIVIWGCFGILGPVVGRKYIDGQRVISTACLARGVLPTLCIFYLPETPANPSARRF